MRAIVLAVVLLALTRPHVEATAAEKVIREMLAHTDPLKDIFSLLDRKQQRAWGKHPNLKNNIGRWKDAFDNAGTELVVNVVMLGFDGTGKLGLTLRQEDLARFLKAIKADLPTVVLQPEVKQLVGCGSLRTSVNVVMLGFDGTGKLGLKL
eukprot:gene30547-35577_t